jgi:putative peptidoglycan lipid II flippase
MTRWALMAYAFAFLGISLVKVLVPAFYARQLTGIPVRYGVISLVVGMATSVALVSLGLWLDWPAPHIALACATSASSLLNAGLLYRRLRRDEVYRPTAGWGAYLARIGLGLAAMTGVTLWLAGSIDSWSGATLSERVPRLALTIAAAAATYFAVLWVAGLRLSHVRGQS